MANQKTLSLLENPIRVSTPFISVKIGDYTFGKYQESSSQIRDNNGAYRLNVFQYPNYIQQLTVAKINGQVNTYTLTLRYAVTPSNDPNFFEKVFSSVSQTRKITFSYGDLAAPNFMYRDEEAIITNLQNQFDLNSATITYTLSAVSSSTLATAGANNFPAYKSIQPSDVIKELLRNNVKYGLLDIFSGMKDLDLVEQRGLIASDDVTVPLDAKVNMSTLDYLKYLVDNMKRNDNKKGIYVLKVIDDTTGDFGGPYFKVINSDTPGDSIDTYELDIGYPSSNVVTSFTINNNEAYSILYNYSKNLNTNEYIEKIDDNGDLIDIYSPLITSNNNQNTTKPDDENWWKNVTEYPISAQVRIKGLLRPAILMSKLRLNVYFYGRKHISSGLYIITKQVDDISENGFFTTLNLVRVGGDTDITSNLSYLNNYGW